MKLNICFDKFWVFCVTPIKYDFKIYIKRIEDVLMQSAHVTGFICSNLVCISVKCQQKVSQIKPAIATIYVDSSLCTQTQ